MLDHEIRWHLVETSVRESVRQPIIDEQDLAQIVRHHGIDNGTSKLICLGVSAQANGTADRWILQWLWLVLLNQSHHVGQFSPQGLELYGKPQWAVLHRRHLHLVFRFYL